MKTKILILILFGLFIIPACQEEFETPDTDALRPEKAALVGEGTIVTEMMHVKALEGNLLGDPADRIIRVYLPKSYYTNPEKRFPVIYFLHGTPAWGGMLMESEPYEFFYLSAQLSARVDFPEEGFLPWLNNLVNNEGMKEAIIVMADAQTKYGPSIYVNSSVEGNYEDYIVKDLVKFIDSNFRTIDHFNWRAITGHCAGAYGALKLAMKHPDIFRYVAGLSPSHFPRETIMYMAAFMSVEDEMWEPMGAPAGPLPYDPLQPFKFVNNSLYFLMQAWLPNPANPPYLADLPFTFVDGVPVMDEDLMKKVDEQNLMALSQKYRQGLKKLKTVYFDCGMNDDLMMYTPNVMLDQQLSDMHIKHQFESFEGTHINHLYQRLEKALVMLSNDFPERDDE
ncbi:alpha/beta hydrolase-fold protein [uncultured Draconibacterium sp.]|uniref:alpha/beta hydrolase n=1 Tax=uncultured Draconibacterium sp. TaxID=1573823 RepID=UPI0029C65EF3|nr:alpha/beta hydrolase-fold protein [uncultured Draconibacterium sp.]